MTTIPSPPTDFSTQMTPNMVEGLMGILGCSRAAQEKLPPSLEKVNGQNVQLEPRTKVAVRTGKKKDDKAIWQPNEFKASSGVVVKDEGDDRAVPKYDILYRQNMGTEEAYLNFMDADSSSDHCTDLTVKIWLPDTQLKDISLDVLEDRLLLQAPKYRLNLALPHKVKKDSGNAKWDKLSGLLKVVIPMNVKVKYYQSPAEIFHVDDQ